MSVKPEKAKGARLELPLPQRRSYDKVVEDIDKWVNSSGLQKPKSAFGSRALRSAFSVSSKQSTDLVTR